MTDQSELEELASFLGADSFLVPDSDDDEPESDDELDDEEDDPPFLPWSFL